MEHIAFDYRHNRCMEENQLDKICERDEERQAVQRVIKERAYGETKKGRPADPQQEEVKEYIKIVKEQPTQFLRDIRHELAEANVHLSIPRINHIILHDLRKSRKRISQISRMRRTTRVQTMREVFRRSIFDLRYNDIAFIDESHFDHRDFNQKYSYFETGEDVGINKRIDELEKLVKFPTHLKKQMKKKPDNQYIRFSLEYKSHDKIKRRLLSIFTGTYSYTRQEPVIHVTASQANGWIRKTIDHEKVVTVILVDKQYAEDMCEWLYYYSSAAVAATSRIKTLQSETQKELFSRLENELVANLSSSQQNSIEKLTMQPGSFFILPTRPNTIHEPNSSGEDMLMDVSGSDSDDARSLKNYENAMHRYHRKFQSKMEILEQRLVQEKKRVDEEKMRADKEKKRANEEKQRADEEKKRANEEKKRANEERKRADEQEKRADSLLKELEELRKLAMRK
jgi:hypothetical protein